MSNPESIEKQAKQLCTKSILSLRFSVDHDQSGIMYDKAANLYKAKNLLSDAARCYQASAREHQKAGNLYHAARALDALATCYRDLKQLKKAIQAYKSGAEIMLEDGKLDRGAEVLVKGAKLIEKELTGKSTTNKKELSQEDKESIRDMYVEALRMYANGDKYHMATGTFRTFNAFLLKNQMYDECLENIKRQTEGYVALKQMHNIWKNNLSLVIVQLQKDADSVAAEELHEQCMAKYEDYASTKECQLASQFIQAFENNDAELLESTIADRDLKYLEAQVSKIARKMTLESEARQKQLQKPQRVKVSAKNEEAKQQTAELLGHDEEVPEVDDEEEEDSLYEDEEPDALDPDNLC